MCACVCVCVGVFVHVHVHVCVQVCVARDSFQSTLEETEEGNKGTGVVGIHQEPNPASHRRSGTLAALWNAPTVRRGYKRAFGSEESADVVLLTDVPSCIKGSLQTEESGSRFIGGSQHEM